MTEPITQDDDPPFIGEMRLFPYERSPKDWLPCRGDRLPIKGNEALYSLLGHTFGGDETTFGLPDMRDRLTWHPPSGWSPGSYAGQDHVGLSVEHLPPHSHRITGVSAQASLTSPAGAQFAESSSTYAEPNDKWVPLHGSTVGSTGQSVAHENRQPYLALEWRIAVAGLYPTRP